MRVFINADFSFPAERAAEAYYAYAAQSESIAGSARAAFMDVLYS